MSLLVDHILLRRVKIKERETWEGRHEFQLSSFSYQIHLTALGVHIQEGQSSPTTKMLHLNRCALLPLSAEAQQLLQERMSNVPEPWTSTHTMRAQSCGCRLYCGGVFWDRSEKQGSNPAAGCPTGTLFKEGLYWDSHVNAC